MNTIYILLQTYPDCPRNQQHAIEHALGLKLLRTGLDRYYKLHLTSEQLTNQIAEASDGKPYLQGVSDIEFNISHCDRLAACALGRIPCGIDIERFRPFKESLVRRVLTEKEQDFLSDTRTAGTAGTAGETPDHLRYTALSSQSRFCRFWTLKESLVKQTGEGLTRPLTEFSFDLDLHTDPPAITCSEPGFYFFQKQIEPDCFLSVCCREPFLTKIDIIAGSQASCIT